MPPLLALAPAPALAAAFLAPAGAPLVLLPPPLRMTLMLDRPGAILLGSAALLWILAGAYAAVSLRGRPDTGRFAEWWLLTLSGSLGVFMAADLVSFYLTIRSSAWRGGASSCMTATPPAGAPAASTWRSRCWARRCC